MAVIDLTIRAERVCQIFHQIVLPNVPESFWYQGVHITDVLYGCQLVAQDPLTNRSLKSDELHEIYKRGIVLVRDELDMRPRTDIIAFPIVSLVNEYRPTKQSNSREAGVVYGYDINELRSAYFETSLGTIISFAYHGDDEYQLMLEHDVDMPLQEEVRSAWKSVSR